MPEQSIPWGEQWLETPCCGDGDATCCMPHLTVCQELSLGGGRGTIWSSPVVAPGCSPSWAPVMLVGLAPGLWLRMTGKRAQAVLDLLGQGRPR